MNSLIYKPTRACAQPMRRVCQFVCFSCFVGTILAIASTSPIFAADPIEPIPGGNNPTVPVSLTGWVFYDENHNAKLDGTEYAIAGAALELFKISDLSTPIASMASDSMGIYSFMNLPPDTYLLRNTTANGNWLPVVGKIDGISGPVVTSLGTADVVNAQINNIELKAGDFASHYNFAANWFPIQLISKRMLLASGGDKLQVVPEPGTAFILISGMIALSTWLAGRRYFF
ncbi:MAG TPA: SdrD B-like domain-containing protein [Thermoguttaceae bacterium]